MFQTSFMDVPLHAYAMESIVQSSWTGVTTWFGIDFFTAHRVHCNRQCTCDKWAYLKHYGLGSLIFFSSFSPCNFNYRVVQKTHAIFDFPYLLLHTDLGSQSTAQPISLIRTFLTKLSKVFFARSCPGRVIYAHRSRSGNRFDLRSEQTI